MKIHLLLLPLLLAISPALHAAKIPNFAIFDNTVYTFNPGMDAVLALTPDQMAKVQAANDAWKNDPQLESTKAAFIASKDAAPDEATAAKESYDSAQKVAKKKYDEALAGIFSSEQTALIDSLNTFGKDMAKEVGNEGTWAEHIAKLKEVGTQRFGEVLAPAQIQLISPVGE